MRTKAEFQAMREQRELLKEIAQLPPSKFATEIVANRPEKSTKEMLRAMAKDMGISVNELAGDIIAAKALAAENKETFIQSGNNVYRVIAIDSDGNAEWDTRYSPIPETIAKQQWESGHTVIEESERRSIVIATIHAEKATRPDYHFGAELLNTIGRDKGVVISSIPDGTVKVLSVHRAIEREYADRAGQRAFKEYADGRNRIEDLEKQIAAVPLSKGGTIKSRIPVALQKEYAKALDAMKSIRARVEKANARIEKANGPSADFLRTECAKEFDADMVWKFDNCGVMPGAIDTWELPNAIVRRPFRETIRIHTKRSPISPVECEVLKNEADREWEILRAQVKAEFEKVSAQKAEQEKAEMDNARSARNAEYKERRAIAARARRAKAKGK